MGITLSSTVIDGLKAQGVSPEIIHALKVAMLHSHVNPYAFSYAKGMDEAWIVYGLDGVKTQVMYLMNNVAAWKGEEAKECKKILRSWK